MRKNNIRGEGGKHGKSHGGKKNMFYSEKWRKGVRGALLGKKPKNKKRGGIKKPINLSQKTRKKGQGSHYNKKKPAFTGKEKFWAKPRFTDKKGPHQGEPAQTEGKQVPFGKRKSSRRNLQKVARPSKLSHVPQGVGYRQEKEQGGETVNCNLKQERGEAEGPQSAKKLNNNFHRKKKWKVLTKGVPKGEKRKNP